ncbi:MAG: tRNA (guanosine(37)-N1)-methyltransferase TrmD [Nitrospiraceae bacterium]|nr:tRNA (guanosine(37)-N1)-methyltransferase TrmD [Nitrospiraceae bacterium]
MKFSIVTIFPEMVEAYLGASILKRAIQKGLITVSVHNLRDFATDKHKTVDDYPYGGGVGMVMKPEPFFRITEGLWPVREERKILVPSPKGPLFDQEKALALSQDKTELVFLCGRYEAIDERVTEHLADEEISIGDYVLTGGELPALVIIDAVSRLIPGVLGDSRSSEEDSFSCGLLDYPHYTRPEDFRGIRVPDVLLSGNHREIAAWRKKRSLQLTMERRPALAERYASSPEDREIIERIKEEQQ